MPSLTDTGSPIVTLVASFASTLTLLTGTTVLVSVFVILTSDVFRSFVAPAISAVSSSIFVCFTDLNAYFFTVTFAVAVGVCVPHFAVAVIVASPAATALTVPSFATVATFSSLVV